MLRRTERSWVHCVDTTSCSTATREDIPGVVFAQVGNTLRTATKARKTVVYIFVFVFDATLINNAQRVNFYIHIILRNSNLSILIINQVTNFLMVISNKVRNLIEKSGDFSATSRNDVHIIVQSVAI